MIAVIQRVKQSRVMVGQEVVGEIGPGLLVLLGVAREDGLADCRYLVDKIVRLRIFEDSEGKMNRSLLDTSGQMLVVSQFTLLGDYRKGRRPSFASAAPPEMAEALYDTFVTSARESGVSVATGRFRAMMTVSLDNDGPVTLIVSSNRTWEP